MLALSETWISADAPPAIKLAIAPTGYSVLHVHTFTLLQIVPGGPTRSGGLAVIHRDGLVVRNFNQLSQAKTSTFELQLVTVRTGSKSIVVANIYRPPNSTSPLRHFFDELTDVIANILASTSNQLVIVGDVNCPGTQPTSVNLDLVSVLDVFCLTQLVPGPTQDNNLLDIVLIKKDGFIVEEVQVDDAGCLSDHRLVLVQLRIGWRRQTSVTFKYRRACIVVVHQSGGERG